MRLSEILKLRCGLRMQHIDSIPDFDQKNPHRRGRAIGRWLLPALILLFACTAYAAGLDLRIAGDRMTLHAEDVPLQQVLRKMAAAGVRVKADPSLDFQVTADFVDRDIGSALAAILKSVDHVLIWKTVTGPIGPLVRLAEVQVFKAGRKDRIRRLVPENRHIVTEAETGSAYVAGEILIRFKPSANREAFQQILDEIGAWIVDSHPALGIYRIRVPENADFPSALSRLSQAAATEQVEPNYAYPLIVFRSEGAILSTIPQPTEGESNGSDFRIAVLDTGISLDDLQKAQVVSAFNAVDPDLPAVDDLGHGTRMALLASGAAVPIGISLEPHTRYPIVAVKAFDDDGYVSAFDFARSIDFAAAQQARVLSLSWGSATDSRFLKDALDYVDKLGMVIVAAAGNEPTGKAVYPAAYDTVIGVGALSPTGKRWKSSNFGKHVALFAPGFVGFDRDGDGTADEAYAGTSVSTAFVSHLAAGLLAANPNMTRGQVIEALRQMLEEGK